MSAQSLTEGGSATSESRYTQYSLRPSRMFNGYNLWFLRNAISIPLTHAVKLLPVKYGLLVKKINDDDLDTLDETIKKLDNDLALTKDIRDTSSLYIKGNMSRIMDARGETKSLPPEGVKGQLTIKLKGYKEINCIKSPMWKLGKFTTRD